ncbi:hypothetical protein F511_32554 [Dorcoceras hygrometricum]|uniref:Uncharacterized protein n=1 Tax=Dorcoceras hygrometricum TaxID=472368 RepID=A0A2Z7CUS2_9LAMI|nr:hypothetical protein F511_32554 [Dorcoceras hygrometricum]
MQIFFVLDFVDLRESRLDSRLDAPESFKFQTILIGHIINSRSSKKIDMKGRYPCCFNAQLKA